MSTLAIASVKSTKVGKGQYNGHDIPVVQGRSLDNNKLITLFPGAVPASIPNQKYWSSKSFNYIAFAPLEPVSEQQVLPHMRMDQVLEFLLGDKLK